ncbi:RibD family protein [Oceanobacillus neutriphilus]|uniref:5-amino-6-(5-phosphoribosylamino)uracil reductase n=1 Tax=Oceanobacillus neutriphilus TaxID=531815 RepID=A0ABQ2NSC5_9BACI|nr:RibD family protein [Oceanobacillus neutriphilus]GGP08857.1 5-amino-6-(5-phosphoribosylamino)uracil reductase [Oceanobacillus neutriphilus]
MNRPYIFCHMEVSVDGKIIGKFMGTPEGKKSGKLFYNLAFGENPHYRHQGWLSGRTTTDDNFTKYKEPDLDKNAAPVPEGDFVVETNLDKYYVSVDASGKLGWTSNELKYQDTTAHVLEVLTEKASNEYKAMLRKLNIPYIIAGKDSLDFQVVVQKLREKFHIETLMLGGGGVLNWSFIQAGLCDEVSIVISPSADGSADSPSLFETKEGLSDDTPVSFTLKDVEAKEDGCVWLRYLVNNK